MAALKGSAPGRFAFLGGIRGIAALMVLVRHTDGFWGFEFYRSYLAVDLFFVLSGFVIANAYDGKLERGSLSIGRFFAVRMIRLYPVYFLSVLLAGVAACVAHADGHNMGTTVELLLAFCLALLMMPFPVTGSNHLFALNSPYWSLLFEILVNLLYAMVRPILHRWVLLLGVAITGLALLGGGIYRGSIDTGFYWSLGSFAGGFTRAFFGIFMGLLLFRYRHLGNRFSGQTLPAWVGVVLVCGALASGSAGRWDPVVDWLLMAFLFPAFVLVASQAAGSRFNRGLILLGTASYPVYVLHKPLGELLLATGAPVISAWAPMSGVLLVLFLVVFSVGLEKVYDIPVRARLTALLSGKRS